MVAYLIIFLKIRDNRNLVCLLMVYGIAQGILKPLNAVYLSNHVQLSKIEITFLMVITMLVDMIVTLSTGLYSDRLTRKKGIPMTASVLCILGIILYLHANSFMTALVAAVLVTSPAGAVMGQLFAMARNHYTSEANSIIEPAMVWLRAAFSFGFFLGLLIGSELFTLISFKGVLLGNAVCYVLLLFGLVLYRERKMSAPPKKTNGVPFQWLVIVAFVMLLTADAIRGLYFPLMVDHLFHNPALVSQLWSIQAIFELLWMTVVGYLATKYGTIRMISISVICGLIVYMTYAVHPTLGYLILAQPVHSFYVSTLYSVGMGYVQRMFLQRVGFGSSLYLVLTQGASLVGYCLPNVVSGFAPSIFYLSAGCVVLALLTLGLNQRIRVNRSQFAKVVK